MSAAAAASGSSSAAPRDSRVKLGGEDFAYGVLLGEGAYARVVHARRRYANGKLGSTDYAIKILDKRLVKREDKTLAVMTERNVLARTADNPLFTRLCYTFQDAAHLYFVLECAPGGQLLDAMRDCGGRLDVDTTRYYAASTIAALEYLHTRLQVCHRDIKPENLLLDSRGWLKIGDFGSAKEEINVNFGEASAQSTAPAEREAFVGTAEYVSPEVLRDEPAHAPADLWSLGCVIYQCLTGRPPFRGASEYLTFQQILGFDSDTSRKAAQQADAARAEGGSALTRNDSSLLLAEPLEAIGCGILILNSAVRRRRGPSTGTSMGTTSMATSLDGPLEAACDAIVDRADADYESSNDIDPDADDGRDFYEIQEDIRRASSSAHSSLAVAPSPTQTSESPRLAASASIASRGRMSRSESLSAARAAGPPQCILRFPEYFPADARDLILNLLQTQPMRRLGVSSRVPHAGEPHCGPIALDYAALKSSEFFSRFDWALFADPSNRPAAPYLPPVRVFPTPRPVSLAAAANGLIGVSVGDDDYGSLNGTIDASSDAAHNVVLSVLGLEGEHAAHRVVGSDGVHGAEMTSTLSPTALISPAPSSNVALPQTEKGFLSTFFSPLFGDKVGEGGGSLRAGGPSAGDGAPVTAGAPAQSHPSSRRASGSQHTLSIMEASALSVAQSEAIRGRGPDSPLPSVRLMLDPNSRDNSTDSLRPPKFSPSDPAAAEDSAAPFFPLYSSTSLPIKSPAGDSTLPRLPAAPVSQSRLRTGPRDLCSFIRDDHIPTPLPDVAVGDAAPPDVAPSVGIAQPLAVAARVSSACMPWAALLDSANGEYALRWGPCEKRKTYGFTRDVARELLITMGGPRGPRLLYLHPAAATSASNAAAAAGASSAAAVEAAGEPSGGGLPKSFASSILRAELDLADPDLDVVLRVGAGEAVPDGSSTSGFTSRVSRWFGLGHSVSMASIASTAEPSILPFAVASSTSGPASSSATTTTAIAPAAATPAASAAAATGAAGGAPVAATPGLVSVETVPDARPANPIAPQLTLRPTFSRGRSTSFDSPLVTAIADPGGCSPLRIGTGSRTSMPNDDVRGRLASIYLPTPDESAYALSADGLPLSSVTDSAAETGRRHSAPDLFIAATHMLPVEAVSSQPCPTVAENPLPPRASGATVPIATPSQAPVALLRGAGAPPGAVPALAPTPTVAPRAVSRALGIFDIHTGLNSSSAGRTFYLYDPLGAAAEWRDAILMAKRMAIASRVPNQAGPM